MDNENEIACTHTVKYKKMPFIFGERKRNEMKMKQKKKVFS